jgi:small-conductance mechanosensitive channel
MQGALLNVILVLFFISMGLLIEFIIRRVFIKKLFLAISDNETQNMCNSEKLTATIARVLPDILGIIIFAAAAYISFNISLYPSLMMPDIWTASPFVQLFFLATVIAVTAIRLVTVISNIIFSPRILLFRVLPMQCQDARASNKLVVLTTAYFVVVLMFVVVARKLGATFETTRLLQLFFATLLLFATFVAVIVNRDKVKQYILDSGEAKDQSLTWGRKQFAEIWHILAPVYLFVLWLLLVDNLADTDKGNSGAFMLSFFVVPIWMIADKIVQWVIRYALSILKIHQQQYDDQDVPTTEDLIERQKGRKLYIRIKGLARIGVVAALFIWVASLWNINIPFFSGVAAVALDALIIMTIALFFWQFISNLIERKIDESLPEEAEEESHDDEWGGAASRGRAYTLLPMIRKFIGSVLVIMVTMTILSSMGVNIGPLLAGAGVVGLAIGFGAQKLVSDMFSGFFYLLDDAFRVGEYLTAGNVSGTVESITLRNIMLRHHRGMLQIVPHSDLGAITNFMRGGITVKFNLDFPYDAPIDKIRKIIKKVGQKMLDDEIYGKDFIRPVKSQGVREITNSVMTIRVKFTAQPGTHFVIRREAYRLITEALNAQGIHFAHRKVIVDLPEIEAGKEEESQHKQIAHAAGAAAQRVIEEEETGQLAKSSDNDAMG